jgi:hypothetical protein
VSEFDVDKLKKEGDRDKKTVEKMKFK